MSIYDASGNRLSYRAGTTIFTNVVSASSNRLASVQRVNSSGGTVTDIAGYDSAGNTTSSGSAGSAVYSPRGRMSAATTPVSGSLVAFYRYNALDQRVIKYAGLVSSGAVYFVHDEAGHLLGEYDATGNPVYEVVWLDDLPIGIIKQTRTGSGTTLAVSTQVDDIYADHLNTPRVIARGSDQAIVWRWESTEPFGVTSANDNPNGLGAYSFNLRFPGQIFDRETNSHYNHHRDYSAWLGRYVQSDPIGLAGGINTYSYVDGDSVDSSDPDGLLKLGPRVPRRNNNPELIFAAACVEACMASGDITITATTNCHTSGAHAVGNGLDIVVPSGRNGSQKATCCALQCAPSSSYIQNEYIYPSPQSTGGHIHIQLTPGRGGATATGRYPRPNCDSCNNR
jgi:RHS repeat-associated protein